MTLTPEMEALVEQIARMLEPKSWAALATPTDSIAHLNRRTSSQRKARAIIPLIYAAGLRAGREEAAKVAESRMPVVQCMSVEPVVSACLDIAASIRDLSEQEKSRG